VADYQEEADITRRIVPKRTPNRYQDIWKLVAGTYHDEKKSTFEEYAFTVMRRKRKTKETFNDLLYTRCVGCAQIDEAVTKSCDTKSCEVLELGSLGL